MNNQQLYNQNPFYPSSLNINPNFPNFIDYNVSVPVSLMKSLEGKYFVGTAENLDFGSASHAWARLYNPPNSGVNLFVNTWTVSDIMTTSYKVGIWLNPNPRGIIQLSENIIPSNQVYVPKPQAKTQLQYAISVKDFPSDVGRAFGRQGLPGTTIISEEESKFIFPPGGSFMISLSNPISPSIPATGSISFGWWEEPII